jgi:hypothetical protein
MKRLFTLIIISIVFYSINVQACIHVPLNYEHEVTYNTEEFFMYDDGIDAHMIIKPTIQIKGQNLPDSLGWIIPVPFIPKKYEEVDSSVFKALFDYVETHKPPVRSTEGLIPTALSKGLILHEKKFVGKYEIQPIELTDYTSGQELLKWFQDNGFKTKNKDISYYLKKHSAYLAIKITNLQSQKEELKPLHIIYPSNTLSVPLKFDSLSGVFDVIIYFIVNEALTNQEIESFNSKQLFLDGTPIKYVPGQSKSEDDVLKRLSLPKGYLYKFKGSKINSSSNSLKDWSEDPTILHK